MICVMHEGEIVEQGSHAVLLAQGGRYAKLWSAQSAESPTVLDSLISESPADIQCRATFESGSAVTQHAVA